MRPCGTYANPLASSLRGPAFVMSVPMHYTRPARARSRPKTVLKTVDLPAPLDPMMVVIVPRRTLKLVPVRIVMRP